ncbi:MAG: ABC transporter substrate-binding protein [Chloroflexia bacterium]
MALIALVVLTACGGTATVTVPAAAPSAAASAAAASAATGGGATATTARPSTAASAAASTAASTAPSAAGSAAASASGAATPGGASPTYGFKPGGGSAVDNVTLSSPVEITLWHTQTSTRETKLKELVAAFEAKNPNIKVKLELQGTYTDLFKKVTAAINGGGLPDIAVSYESMVSEYQSANVVQPLEDYINSAKYGLSAQDLADFYPLYITSNQYPEFKGQMLSFPFTKSVLVMYYNADKLKEANIAVPKTWDEFSAACKKFTGDTKGYAISIDASTFDGAVFSRGGKLISDDFTSWQFNGAEGQAYLTMLQDLVKSGCAYLIDKANADQDAFGQGKVAFTMGSSSGFPFYQTAVNNGAKFNWSVAMIPQGSASATPVTTSYGANIAMFNKSTAEKKLASWLFIKYFTSTEVNADWSSFTGYLPIRKSTLDNAAVKAQFDKLPAYKVAVTEIQQYGRGETTVKGTQDTRTFIQDAMTAAVTDPSTKVKDLLDEAVKKGNAALKQN